MTGDDWAAFAQIARAAEGRYGRCVWRRDSDVLSAAAMEGLAEWAVESYGKRAAAAR